MGNDNSFEWLNEIGELQQEAMWAIGRWKLKSHGNQEESFKYNIWWDVTYVIMDGYPAGTVSERKALSPRDVMEGSWSF